jgi:hypothetical protein
MTPAEGSCTVTPALVLAIHHHQSYQPPPPAAADAPAAAAAAVSALPRLFKLPGQLEAPPQEDYGQTVTYNGTIPGAAADYHLDSEHIFAAGKPHAHH